MKRFYKKLSLFLVFCMVTSAMMIAGPLAVFAAGGRTITVGLKATPEEVTKLLSGMANGDTLSYEKRGDSNVLEAVKKDGSLTIEVWPGATLTENQDIIRTAMYALKPGDTLLFHEGTYGNLLPKFVPGGSNRGTDQVYLSGAPGKPITIKGYGNGEARPVITRDGVTNHDLWTIYGSYIDVSYMTFYNATGWAIGLTRMTKTESNTGLITDISIKDCVFDSNWDCSIAANWSWYHYNNITIENNVFKNPYYTFVYIGQADGRAWADNVVVRNNFFVGGPNYRADSTGYALEYKKNVHNSLVENNLVLNMKGPGIAVYGADTTDEFGAKDVLPNVLRYNLVLGSGEGVNALGGPVRMYNNVAFENGYMGIRVQQRSSQTAVRRDMKVHRNTSGFNGYDAWEPGYPVDYSNLGPGSTTITDLATGGSVVQNNVYYGTRDTDATSLKVQLLIKELRALTEKPAGFDKYFADLAVNPGPFTMEQLAEKLSVLVSAPSDAVTAEYKAYVTAVNKVFALGLLDTTKSLEALTAQLTEVVGAGISVEVKSFDYLTYMDGGIIDLPYYEIAIAGGAFADTIYLSGNIADMKAAREVLMQPIVLPNDSFTTGDSLKAALEARLGGGFNGVKIASVTMADTSCNVKLEVGSGFITFSSPYANAEATRGMFVQMLYDMAGSPAASGSGAFADVASGAWCAAAVQWAAGMDIVVGVGQNLFNPNGAITRQELVTVLQRYAAAAGLTLPASRDEMEFADADSVAAYAKAAVQALYRSNVINSKANKVFDPTGTVTQTEAAALIKAFVDNVVNAK